MFVHQLQQQRPRDVGVILQFAVQRHRQQGGEITSRPSVEVRTTLQRVDELDEEKPACYVLTRHKMMTVKYQQRVSLSSTNAKSSDCQRFGGRTAYCLRWREVIERGRRRQEEEEGERERESGGKTRN